MKPLLVLLTVFVLSLLAGRLVSDKLHFRLAGCIALSAMLLFTALGHFIFTQGMAAMLPEIIPYRRELVYLTGLFEIVFAIGLVLPGFRKLTGWMVVVFLLLVLPANIYAATQHLNYQTGMLNGPGLSYLWLRVPLQLFFIGWAYLSAIRAR